MKIKYRHDSAPILTIDCPFRIGQKGFLNTKVGSINCKSHCDYFISVNREARIVECNYKECHQFYTIIGENYETSSKR